MLAFSVASIMLQRVKTWVGAVMSTPEMYTPKMSTPVKFLCQNVYSCYVYCAKMSITKIIRGNQKKTLQEFCEENV